MIAHLDTHVALWLVAGEKRRLRPVEKLLRTARLYVSPLVLVEMEILREIGRIRESADTIFEVLTADFDVQQASTDLDVVALSARNLAWTRDPFDRLIVGAALAEHALLLTADQTIRKHCPSARWD